MNRLREGRPQRSEEEPEIARIKNEAASEEAAPEDDGSGNEERGRRRVPPVPQNRFTSWFPP
jgi:hypothetical protein